MKAVALVALAASFLCGFRCSFPLASSASQNLTIAAYNAHNLFDAEDDGGEYEEFTTATGWSREKYERRLENVGLAISSIFTQKGRCPDILCLEEIEGQSVLEDLAGGVFKSEGYRWIVSGGPEDSAIVCGLLSRIPVSGVLLHRVEDSWGFGPGRDILEVTFDIPENSLTIFLCHWKSRREGAELTEPARRASASLLRGRIESLEKEFPGRPILVCGDFNESPDEFARMRGAYPTALMPDPGEAIHSPRGVGDIPEAWLAQALVVSKSPSSIDAGGLLYSPWASEGGYSYVFDGEEQQLDGFLLNAAFFDNRGLEYSSFLVGTGEKLMDSSGEPLAWDGSGGFSDHLPIALSLSRSQ